MSKEIDVSTSAGKQDLSPNPSVSSLSSSTNPKGAFSSSGLSASYYAPIANYEGIARYDPSFTWDPVEERKVKRKIDKRICTWVCLMFFALQLDRGNITQALSDNMLKDLKLNTNHYNYGQTIFYVSFLAAELPSQLISKKLGPGMLSRQYLFWC
jgi:hypothetical protein